MEDLFSPVYSHSPLVAQPAVCFIAHFSADFSNGDMSRAILQLFDTFTQISGASLKTCTLEAPSAKKYVRLTKATNAKLASTRDALAEGMPKHRYLHIYGAESDAASLPRLPVLRLAHAAFPMTSFELALPASDPRARDFMMAIDDIVTTLPIMAGALGYGFRKIPNSFGLWDLPAAHRRYRAAMIPNHEPFSSLVRYDEVWLQSARLFQRQKAQGKPISPDQIYDYTPGLPDIGWRTYVGTAFRDRLGAEDGLAEAGVAVEHRATHTLVTAGPAPIWGDLNAGEDIGAYRAAYRYLKPALADRDMRLKRAPCYDSSVPERVREAEDYLNRFEPGKGA